MQSVSITPFSPVPTRKAGLQQLDAFLGRASTEYARKRNFDFGPAQRSNVSCLSPYLRYRILSEQEVVTAVLQEHGQDAAEKFLQEVAWRTYWKGWLEMRPQLWDAYRESVRTAHKGMSKETKETMNRVLQGTTGIDCMDFWSLELQQNGYLHNHARMWFASIWIFYLALPWELGADFFLRELLDADPASNTLSWRWVAGLHTNGKTYTATRENIRKFTNNRFKANLPAPALPFEAVGRYPKPQSTPIPTLPLLVPKDVPTALILSTDDLGGLDDPQIRDAVSYLVPRSQLRHALIVLHGTATRFDKIAKHTQVFLRAAAADAQSRLAVFGVNTRIVEEPDHTTLSSFRSDTGVERLLVPSMAVGRARTWLRASSVPYDELRRPWDAKLWPHSTSGFFKFKKALPRLFDEIKP